MGKFWTFVVALIIVAFLAQRSPGEVFDLIGDGFRGALAASEAFASALSGGNDGIE